MNEIEAHFATGVLKSLLLVACSVPEKDMP